MEEEWLFSGLKMCFVGSTYFEYMSLHNSTKGPRWRRGRKHDRASVCKERYAAFCAGCVGSEKNEMKHNVLCRVRSMCVWVKRKEVVNGARRIRSEKLRANQHKE